MRPYERADLLAARCLGLHPQAQVRRIEAVHEHGRPAAEDFDDISARR
jgi:hypothetical protein